MVRFIERLNAKRAAREQVVAGAAADPAALGDYAGLKPFVDALRPALAEASADPSVRSLLGCADVVRAGSAEGGVGVYFGNADRVPTPLEVSVVRTGSGPSAETVVHVGVRRALMEDEHVLAASQRVSTPDEAVAFVQDKVATAVADLQAERKREAEAPSLMTRLFGRG